MNQYSKYPIMRRIMGTDQWMFFLEMDVNIQVEVPSFPARDTPETSDAIEWGARVVDSFTFSAILPSEFIFLTKKEHVGMFDHGVRDEPDAITYISPVYADPVWPKEYNGYILTNSLSIEVQEGDETKMPILEVIRDYSTDVYTTIMDWVAHGQKLSELVMTRAYMNGSQKECGALLHDDGVFELVAPDTNKLYTVNVYVNLHNINAIRRGENMKFVGTIEKY